MPKASKADAKRLAALSVDCSFLLSHLIRQWQDSERMKTNAAAQQNLIDILALGDTVKKPVLKGSEVGWYSSIDAKIHNPTYPHNPSKPGNFYVPTTKKSVCFTESTLLGLRAHRDVFGVKYGVAFDRDELFLKGAHPCLNISGEILKSVVNKKSSIYSKLFNFIPDKLTPFINIINESFDAGHEREWRYPGSLKFKHDDVKFIFCPKKDFCIFSKFQKDGLPVLFDLEWLDRI